ncbi:hypothetical protein PG988_004502 [Apiospora saccharicola]
MNKAAPDNSMENISVAVIGTGPAGMTTLKCLREEGFNAVGLERRDHIGGLWSTSSNKTFTSVLDGTVTNISKFITGFSDYPLPQDGPDFLTSAKAAKYFEGYASHFGLHQHVRFGTTVHKVVRNKADTAWDIYMTDANGDSIQTFDKVAFCHGCESVPSLPPMPNRARFAGQVIHAQAYRSEEDYKGKRVLVVGNGNTACEAAVKLSKHASKVYQSYRRGRAAFSRQGEAGVPFDTGFSWPSLRLKYFLDYSVPWLTWPFANRAMNAQMIRDASRTEPVLSKDDTLAERRKRTERRMREDWHILPCASLEFVHPIVQDEFVPALRRGDVIPVRGFKAFVSKTGVQLADDMVVDVDVVIFCTGYTHDFDILPELEMNGACGLPLKTTEQLAKQRSKDEARCSPKGPPHLPRLFQMMFPPKRADSIAFVSWMAPQEGSWSISELASMALAQVWAAETAKATGLDKQSTAAVKHHRAPALLPSQDVMNAQVDQYHAWWRREWKKEHGMRSGYVQAHPFYRFLHGAAGTGLYEHLDHALSGRGWRLWWQDADLWTWLARGPMNNYAYRIFDTNPDGVPGCGRKAWPEARDTLKQSYEYFKGYQQEMQNKCKEKLI